jgi:type I restriction enzyme S subunit
MEVRQGYRKTEAGVIPNDWKVKSIEQLCVPNGLVRGPFGGSLKKEYFVETGFKVYEQKNAIYKNPNLGTYYIDTPKFILLKRFEVKVGDFIVSCSGTIGKIFQIPENSEKGIINQALLKLKLNNEIIDDRFFYYYFDWDKFQLRIIDNTQGGAMKNLVGMSIFRNTLIPIPPTKAEQTAIATALSDADALLSSVEKLIAKKRNIKQGAIQELLTGKKRLPGFTGEWEVKELGAIFSISAGGDLIKETFSPIKDSKYCYPIYSNSLTNKGLYWFSKLYRHDENCITVTARGTIGVANARDHKFDAIGRVLVLKPICELNCLFISEYLNHKVNFSIESTGVPQLTAPQISKYQIVFPKPDEQTAIAQILSDMDAEIEALEKKLTKYRMIKHGMMQELLTGKTRLV